MALSLPRCGVRGGPAIRGKERGLGIKQSRSKSPGWACSQLPSQTLQGPPSLPPVALPCWGLSLVPWIFDTYVCSFPLTCDKRTWGDRAQSRFLHKHSGPSRVLLLQYNSMRSQSWEKKKTPRVTMTGFQTYTY